MDLKVYTVVAPTLHLGSTGVVLRKGHKVESDGNSLVRINGKDSTVAAFSGAIRAGWVVLEGQEEGTTAPTRNPVTISKADGSGEKVEVRLVGEEEGVTRPIKSSDSGVDSVESDDQVVVAKIKTSAKSGRVEVGKDDRKVIDSIEKSKLNVERVKIATGDVEEATSGESLEELLPSAEVAGKVAVAPEPEPEESEPEPVEPMSESQIRQAKAEVLSVVYSDVDYKFNAPWRSRARSVFEAYQKSGDTTMLEAFMSIESESVKREIARRVEKHS